MTPSSVPIPRRPEILGRGFLAVVSIDRVRADRAWQASLAFVI